MSAAALRGRHVLVTGASRGIGAAIARILAEDGAQLTLLGRDRIALEASLQGVRRHALAGTTHHLAVADVTDPVALQEAVAGAQRALGPIHILVNNAGQAQSSPIDQTPLALWQQLLQVNLTAVFQAIQAVLPSMRSVATEANPGRIINIASTAGLQGYPQVSAYVAAKHGVVGLTRALALELAKEAITVNAVCPGYTDTDLAAQAVETLARTMGKSQAQARALIARRNPQQRLVSPEEVAAAVRWLCQPASRSINGQAVAVDGGELVG